MPMVNGKKYPYTKQKGKKAAKTGKVKKAEGGMLSKVKNTQNEDIKDASDAKPAFRTPLPFMCGGGAYKTNSSSKSRMRKAEGGPVQKVMKNKQPKDRDNPEQEDIRYRNNNNGNGNGRKN